MQAARQRDALGRRELLENLLLLVLRQVFEDVDGVVGIELAHALGDRFGRQLVENFLAHRIVDLDERREVEIGAHQLDQAGTFILIERFDQVAEIGFMQVADETAQRRRIGRFDCGADARNELGADRALVVAQHRVVAACRGVAFCLEHRILPSSGAHARALRARADLCKPRATGL